MVPRPFAPPASASTSLSSCCASASAKLGSGSPSASISGPMPTPDPASSSCASSSSTAMRTGVRCGVCAEEEETLGAAGRDQSPACIACAYTCARAWIARKDRDRNERRTRGSRACSRQRLAVKVEVDERVEFLQRERLRCLVVNEHTLPFLRGLLVALEHYHLIALDKVVAFSPSALYCRGREDGRVRRGGESGADERWLWVAQP